MQIFTERFGLYICDGEQIHAHHAGFDLTATLHADDDSTPPWKREDGHGEVSEWTDRKKAPGERVLSRDGRSFYRYYDFQDAVQRARREGWRTEGDESLTLAQRAVKAAERDFNVLRAWCNSEWHYFGVAITVSKSGVQLTGDFDHAAWGIEGNYPDSDNSYFVEVANDLAGYAIAAAKAKLAELRAA